MIDLDALRAKNLPRMSWSDILTCDGEASDETKETIRVIDEYVRQFVRPEYDSNGGTNCPACGSCLTGLTALLQGGWEYDLSHGEGHCAQCRYPGRADHYIGPDRSKPIVVMRRRPLMYHPDELTQESPNDADEA